jgi:hypothetical protein
MTEPAPEPANDGQVTVDHAALADATDGISVNPAEPLAAAAAASGAASPSALPTAADERPELLVGAAFAGGLVLAILLKRLAR